MCVPTVTTDQEARPVSGPALVVGLIVVTVMMMVKVVLDLYCRAWQIER